MMKRLADKLIEAEVDSLDNELSYDYNYLASLVRMAERLSRAIDKALEWVSEEEEELDFGTPSANELYAASEKFRDVIDHIRKAENELNLSREEFEREGQ